MMKHALFGQAVLVGATDHDCGFTAVAVNGRDDVENVTFGLYNQPQPGNEGWLPVTTLVKRKCRK